MRLDSNIKSEVMGHPAGLFILFFTEMWERFSYYGMRALLVLFLVSAAGLGGWEWETADALKLYGVYTGLVYLTPIFGGILADKVIGYRKAVVWGALLMTLGHASMVFETPFTFYLGLGLIILGNGLFKPNISSIVSGLYVGNEKKKDAGYTIFYMGINAGAFLGILLCGYIGEKVGWSYGFGLAGVFMFIGMLQFIFAQKMFGQIGLKPEKELKLEAGDAVIDGIGADDILDSSAKEVSEGDVEITPKVRKDRLIVIGVLAFFTIFFWMAFEQAGGSMTIFAKDYTDRILTGDAAKIFTLINAILVIVPMAVLSWVLFKLFRATFSRIALSNIFLGTSFLVIWAIVAWMVNKDYNSKTYIATIDNTEVNLRSDLTLSTGQELFVVDVDGEGSYRIVGKDNISSVKASIQASALSALVVEEKAGEVEVPASWFGVLNSLFIILLAPLFSKLWESKFNPSAAIKFALGLILLGVGFGILAYGAMGIGETVFTVSMVWLILAYFFHTLGELTLSPVGLSYVSKLSPPGLLSLMFGVWFTATFVANLLAGLSGSLIDKITEAYSLSAFFLIFTALPILAGLVLIFLNPMLKKKMHGIK
jgi:POT family proton-dependent oligopeptide transporter